MRPLTLNTAEQTPKIPNLGGLLGNMGRTLPVAFIRPLKPEVRPDAVRQVVGLGPLKLVSILSFNYTGYQKSFRIW